MAIFIILAAAIVIAVSVWKERQKNIVSIFSHAATELDLRFSTDGTVMRRPWIFGETSGIRVDVRPFTRNKNGTQATWTGYRLTFPHPINPSFVGENDPKRPLMARLTNRFAECSISDDELFCARSGLVEDSSRLIADVRLLINTARNLMEHGKDSEVAKPPLPPPLPVKPEPVVQEVEIEEAAEPKFHTVEFDGSESEASGSQIPAPEEPEPASTSPLEQKQDAVTVLPETEIGETATRETIEADSLAKDPPPQSLGAAAKDLFDSGRNRFQISRTFADAYGDRTLEGTGILRRVDRYSNDRYLGRGPGYLAEVEIRHLENPTGGLSQISAVVQLPGDEDSGMGLSEWREKIGEHVLVCGTLVHCDAFTGKLFLRNGLVDSPLASAST
ncbi:MAG: hypothetical protein KDN19_15655 [Verrucomicrobiae bacterium]|nr:hypothetical protein [Verrucomicrobiae bacterium]